MAPSERNLTVVNGFQFLERITSDRILQLKTYFEQLFRNKQLKQTEDQILSTEAFDSYKMRKSIFQLVLTARSLIGSRSLNQIHSQSFLVHGLEIDEEPKVFRCCPEMIKTEVPEINFDVLPHNFCNHRRSMTNEKYHSVSFIILDRIDYLSRRTYRPLIEDQYKQLRTVFLDF